MRKQLFSLLILLISFSSLAVIVNADTLSVVQSKVNVNLVSKERTLFGGVLVYNLTSTSNLVLPSVSASFSSAVDHYEKLTPDSQVLSDSLVAGSDIATLDATTQATLVQENLVKTSTTITPSVNEVWEYQTLVTTPQIISVSVPNNQVYPCLDNQTSKLGICTLIQNSTINVLSNVTKLGWLPLTNLNGINLNNGDSLLVRQTITGGLSPFETADVVPTILGVQHPEFSFLWSTATREVNVTVLNPTGHSITNATFEVRFNQTTLTGSDCALGTTAFAVSDGTKQYALNSTGLGAYPLAWNNSNGDFIVKIRMGGLIFTNSAVVSAYCNVTAAWSSSNTWMEFSNQISQDGFIWVSDGAGAINPLAGQANVGVTGSYTYNAPDFWGNTTSQSFNRTSTGTDHIDSSLQMNTSDDVWVYRMNPWNTISSGGKEYVWTDVGGGYANTRCLLGTFGAMIFNGFYTAGAACNQIPSTGVWSSYASIWRLNANNTMVLNGVVNGTTTTGVASVVSGFNIDMFISTSGGGVEGAFTEVGFMKGQPTYVNEDWLRVFENLTLTKGNYTITTLTPNSSPPVWTSNSTTPVNGSVWSPSLYVTFNVSWNDTTGTEIFNLDGVNTTLGSVNTNVSTTKLSGGYHTWYFFTNATPGGAYNQTNVFQFYLQPRTTLFNLLLNGSSSGLTLLVGSASNSSVPSVNTTYPISISLYRNGTLIQTQNVAPQLDNYTVENTLGTFNVTAYFAGDGNYSSLSISRNINVVNTLPPSTSGGGKNGGVTLNTNVILNDDVPSEPNNNFVGIIAIIAVALVFVYFNSRSQAVYEEPDEM